MLLAPLLVFFATAAVSAQPAPDACASGQAEAVIDPGDVAASVFNTGALFFGNETTNGNGYLVPKGTGRSPVYAASLWLGGIVGGEVRAASANYSGFVFRPGPLGPDGTPPADCSAYDRIYTVSRADVEAYYRTGVATDDLRDWPVGLGAPVLDGDGDPTNYDLAGGDQPAVRGDETAWWLMHDGAVTTPFPSPTPRVPLGVEVRVEAFAFAGPAQVTQTTFYRYTLTNRTAATIDSAYAGVFVDSDLGDASDDYVGSDSTAGLAYTYNADDADAVYGTPPAVGVQVLGGPVGLPNGRDDDRDGAADEPGERLLTTAVPMIWKAGSPAATEPSDAPSTYFRLQGLWGDGAPLREMGTGYEQPSTAAPTRYAYAGNPSTGQFWSEMVPGTGSRNPAGDRRMAVATGPFRLGPGASETVTFAFPFAQGTSNLDSVTRLRALAGLLRAVAAVGGFDPSRVEGAPFVALPPVDDRVSLSRPSPNPFTEGATVTVRAPSGTALRATLHDVLGRLVATLHDAPTDGAETTLRVEGSGLAPGVYVVRVVVPAGEETVTIVRR